MNKRSRNLIILLTIMLLAVVSLCACIAEQTPATEDSTATTTNPGYGVDSWGDVEVTVDNAESDTPETSEQGSEDSSASTEATTTTTNATTPDSGDTTNAPEAGSLNYEQFMNLSTEKQQAYALSFPSVEEYVLWFNAEKEKYEQENENDDVIEITGPIDLGDYNEN